MRYYVVADVHGFYDEMITALTEQNYFNDTEPHKLVICGDLFDRGTQALKLQEFVLDLLGKDEVVLIRGNHEDLACELMNEWHLHSFKRGYHKSNGTINTVCQLIGMTFGELFENNAEAGRRLMNSPYIKTIIPAMHDYYETDHYIFVHGWIPTTLINISHYKTECVYIEEWRRAGKKAWEDARWLNGMEMAHGGVIEKNKTIICGHWHCSYGHANYENKGGEFDDDSDFTPYYSDGIIAIDACTAVSGKVNCIVIDD